MIRGALDRMALGERAVLAGVEVLAWADRAQVKLLAGAPGTETRIAELRRRHGRALRVTGGCPREAGAVDRARGVARRELPEGGEMISTPLTASLLEALDREAPAEAKTFRARPSHETADAIGARLGGRLGEACHAYGKALRALTSGEGDYEASVERAARLLVRALIVAVCIAAAGCGEPFTEESEGPEVIFLEYGVWQAPPAEDVCVDLPRPTRPGPDAGRSK